MGKRWAKAFTRYREIIVSREFFLNHSLRSHRNGIVHAHLHLAIADHWCPVSLETWIATAPLLFATIRDIHSLDAAVDDTFLTTATYYSSQHCCHFYLEIYHMLAGHLSHTLSIPVALTPMGVELWAILHLDYYSVCVNMDQKVDVVPLLKKAKSSDAQLTSLVDSEVVEQYNKDGFWLP